MSRPVLPAPAPAGPAATKTTRPSRDPHAHLGSLLLIAPALITVGLLFLYPLGYSLVWAFRDEAQGGWSLANFTKAFDFYSLDILFTVVIVTLATLIIGVLSIAIGGYLTLGENRVAVAALRWLYRWPLFIPFVVAGQLMRTFLAKNGMMNNMLVGAGVLDPLTTTSFLDWRGIVITFVWKQTPFAALLVAGAMASLDRSTMEAARNLGAGRVRVLLEIVVPQVTTTLMVALILSYVVMMSVLSVPLMINAQTPTMLTVDMAWRINSYGDYPVANALGFISYAMTAVIAWVYLRHGIREGGKPRVIARASLSTAVRAVVLGLLAFAIFGPIANMLLWAVAEAWYFPHKLPVEWGFSFWERVFRPQGNAMESLVNSVLIALATVAASLAIAIPAGLALGRGNLPWRSFFLLLFLLPQAFPSVAVHMNIAHIFYKFGLNGTYVGVTLVHTIQGLVFAVWIATAAFAAVDRELEEAARNMGASPFQAFRTVTLPLALPGILASAIFVFLISLDEFTGTFFVGVPDITTMPLLLFTASMEGNYQIASITALILLVPSVAFMLVIEKFLRADVLAKVGT